MNKNIFAPLPPMGWNSYDYYDTTVSEIEIKAAAKCMAEHLLPYGWDTIVIDIEWYSYDTGLKRPKYQYIPFGHVEMDQYGRLLPCPDKFPSSTNGRGFTILAEYIHSLGLKFGIHIMRGIPRKAALEHYPIWNGTQTLDEVADPASICQWNPDMYGVRPSEKDAQTYYDSIFALYAEWGVDFVKCDDICRMDMPSAKEEIRMLHVAIERCGRPIVLSLSPGPALIEEAWWYEKHANMWRITDDLWDNWELLYAMFERCEVWQNHVRPGCYPDCDMLPFGKLGKGFGQEWSCKLTYEEQKTMMTLWCIFRSPLMLGGDITQLDEQTMTLLTNKDILSMLSEGNGAQQYDRNDSYAIWIAYNKVKEGYYIAVFNFKDECMVQEVNLIQLINEYKNEANINDYIPVIQCRELWQGKEWNIMNGIWKAELQVHGVSVIYVQLLQ